MLQNEMKWHKITQTYNLQSIQDQSVFRLHVPEQNVFNGFTPISHNIKDTHHF